MDTVDRRWCIVHNSVRYKPGHCEWDILIGDRPGRGVCKFVVAEISYNPRATV